MFVLKSAPSPRSASNIVNMALDLAESDANCRIKVDVPGVDKESVTLDVTKVSMFAIRTERKAEKEQQY